MEVEDVTELSDLDSVSDSSSVKMLVYYALHDVGVQPIDDLIDGHAKTAIALKDGCESNFSACLRMESASHQDSGSHYSSGTEVHDAGDNGDLDSASSFIISSETSTDCSEV